MQAYQPSVYIFCSGLQQVSKGGVHTVQSMAFGATQDTRPPPPSWPTLGLPDGEDFVFVALMIGYVNSIERAHLYACTWVK